MPSAADESALDPGFRRAVPDHRGIGSTADEEFDRLDEHRLARTRLTGQRGEARLEHQVELLDDPEVLDV